MVRLKPFKHQIQCECGDDILIDVLQDNFESFCIQVRIEFKDMNLNKIIQELGHE